VIATSGDDVNAPSGDGVIATSGDGVTGLRRSPSGPSSSAGSSTKSPKIDVLIIAIIKIANCRVGLNWASMNGSIEQQLISIVWTIALAQFENESAIACCRVSPNAKRRVYQFTKCNVSLTAIPIATLAVKIPAMSIE
jgi:hypothetical protein